jgi:hypothetical protein
MLHVLSILSVESLFYIPSGLRNSSVLQQTLQKHTPIVASERIHSDHLTKASILWQYRQTPNKKEFVKHNYLNKNNIKRAILVHEQL